jgi:hypothetical protein
MKQRGNLSGLPVINSCVEIEQEAVRFLSDYNIPPHPHVCFANLQQEFIYRSIYKSSLFFYSAEISIRTDVIARPRNRNNCSFLTDTFCIFRYLQTLLRSIHILADTLKLFISDRNFSKWEFYCTCGSGNRLQRPKKP